MSNNTVDADKSSLSNTSSDNDSSCSSDSDHLFSCSIFGFSSRNPGGVEEIGSLTFTYGSLNQASFSGPYSGLQCTTMSLTAIIHSTVNPRWTPNRINKVLKEGNRLHIYLRNMLKLSQEPDGKIAIEDIPHDRLIKLGNVFGRLTSIKLERQHENIFTSELEGFEDFLTVREYLNMWAPACAERSGFLITLGESSYGIILDSRGTALLFDSHGHLTHNGGILKRKAGVLKFPSVQELEEFLLIMFGRGTHAVIAQLSVTFETRAVPEQRPVKTTEDVTPAYKPYIPEVQTPKEPVKTETPAQITVEDHIEEISPFIAMMGGGD